MLQLRGDRVPAPDAEKLEGSGDRLRGSGQESDPDFWRNSRLRLRLVRRVDDLHGYGDLPLRKERKGLRVDDPSILFQDLELDVGDFDFLGDELLELRRPLDRRRAWTMKRFIRCQFPFLGCWTGSPGRWMRGVFPGKERAGGMRGLPSIVAGGCWVSCCWV
jgi:hypothetical protein